MTTIFLNVYGTGNKSSVNQAYTLKDRATVEELLVELEEKKMLPKRFGDTTNYQDLLVLVDRQNIFVAEGLATVLRDGVRVMILPAIAGG